MEILLQQVDINTVINLITVVVILASLRWQLPSKSDIQRLDQRIDSVDKRIDSVDKRIDSVNGRIDKLESKMDEGFSKVDERFLKVDERFLQQDAKLDALRLEMKADMQRLEDKLERANEYHARSVDLLDAIRRGLEVRREPL
ncbi:MAG: hypothetical protein F4063_01395 [Chloroflexi bacterium]|nr:hypothetical protein [Chloroflexota bacterium]